MAKIQCLSFYYPVSLILPFLVVLVQLQSTTDTGDSATTSPLRTPPIAKTLPLSPVTYSFTGQGGKICPVLSSATTAVVQAVVSDMTQLFTVDLPVDVPIMVEQMFGNCRGNNVERCLSLYITTDRPYTLPEGNFRAFLAGNQTTISYGPLGLSLPNRRSTVIFDSTHQTVLLYYRTLVSGGPFRVCSNGTLVANFTVGAPSNPMECQVGSEGGFTVPFKVTVTYTGSEPFVGQIVVASNPCSSPQTGMGLFIDLDVRSPVEPSSTIPVTPMDTPPPPTPSNSVMSAASHPSMAMTLASSVSTTPTFQPPTTLITGRSSSTRLIVGVVIGVLVFFLIILISFIVYLVMCKGKGRNIRETLLRHRSINDGKEDTEPMRVVTDTPLHQRPPPSEIAESCLQDGVSPDEVQVDVHHCIEVPPSDDDNSNSVTNPSPTLVVANQDTATPPLPPPRSTESDNADSIGAMAASPAAISKLAGPTELEVTVPNKEVPPPALSDDDTPSPLFARDFDGDQRTNKEERHEIDGKSEASRVPGLSPTSSDMKHEFTESVESEKQTLCVNSLDRISTNSNNRFATQSKDKKFPSSSSEEGRSKYTEDELKLKDRNNSRPERFNSGSSLPVSRKELRYLLDETVQKVKTEVTKVVQKGVDQLRDDHYEDRLAENQDQGEDYSDDNVTDSPHNQNGLDCQSSDGSNQVRRSSSSGKDKKNMPNKDKYH